MDQQSQRNIEQKREIVLRLDASRRIIAEGSVGMGRRITPGHMVSSYLKRHPLVAFGATSIGAAALTYLLFPGRREGKNQAPQSLRESLLGWIPSFLKGSIRTWILRQIRDYLLTKRP